MIYRDAGKSHFTLTKGNAEDPVTHNFGIAVVTLLDEEGASTAINMLSGVAYVAPSSPMRRQSLC